MAKPTPIRDLSEITPAMILLVVGKRYKKSQQVRQVEIIPKMLNGFRVYGPKFNFMQPHVLVDTLSQLGHESAEFCTTKEFGTGQWYWPQIGRSLLQRTHLEGYQKLTRWVWKHIDKDIPDLSLKENWYLIEKFPYAFFSTPEFWSLHSLWGYSDRNNFRGMTKKINGGYNGMAHRIKLRGRFSLMMLGYGPRKNAYRDFQRDHGLRQTDEYDKETQKRMFQELKALPALTVTGGVIVPGDGANDNVTINPDLEKFMTALLGTLVTFAQSGLGKTLLGGLMGTLGLGALTGGEVAGVGLDIMKGDWGALINLATVALGSIAQMVKAPDTVKTPTVGGVPVDPDIADTITAIATSKGVTADDGKVAEAIGKFLAGTLVTGDDTELGTVMAIMMDSQVDEPNDVFVNALKFAEIVQKGRLNISTTAKAPAKAK